MSKPGPVPKDPSTRSRRNKPTPGSEFRVVEITPGKQPGLIDLLGEDNPITGEPWRQFTFDTWAELNGFPSTRMHLPAQWRRLAIAVAYEEAAMLGKAPAAEGRQRISKHFIDPDDLLKGRILTVEADEAEVKTSTKSTSKKPTAKKRTDPRGHLSSVS